MEFIENETNKIQSLSSNELFDCYVDLINYGLSVEVDEYEATTAVVSSLLL
jgi:hypothetical protein